MEPARPLRDVFADLAEPEARGHEPHEVLRANGHPDLPEPLVAEAVVSYADTAPHEVAEHLAPFVQAASPVPLSGGQAAAADPDWFGLLATAPRVVEVAEPEPPEPAALPEPAAGPGGIDLAFGHGDVVASHGDIDMAEEQSEPYGVATEAPVVAELDDAPPTYAADHSTPLDDATLDDVESE